MKTEQSLARIFAICDHVAESGEAIRTEEEARECAMHFLGIEKAAANKLDAFSIKWV